MYPDGQEIDPQIVWPVSVSSGLEVEVKEGDWADPDSLSTYLEFWRSKEQNLNVKGLTLRDAQGRVLDGVIDISSPVSIKLFLAKDS